MNSLLSHQSKHGTAEWVKCTTDTTTSTTGIEGTGWGEKKNLLLGLLAWVLQNSNFRCQLHRYNIQKKLYQQ
jgi:hypothetical protein